MSVRPATCMSLVSAHLASSRPGGRLRNEPGFCFAMVGATMHNHCSLAKLVIVFHSDFSLSWSVTTLLRRVAVGPHS